MGKCGYGLNRFVPCVSIGVGDAAISKPLQAESTATCLFTRTAWSRHRTGRLGVRLSRVYVAEMRGIASTDG